METAKPNLAEARAFAEGVRAAVPHQKLAYNLSPSFNWDAAGMSKPEMAAFNRELGRLGFVWQVRYSSSLPSAWPCPIIFCDFIGYVDRLFAVALCLLKCLPPFLYMPRSILTARRTI